MTDGETGLGDSMENWDLAARKGTQQALHAAEERLRLALDAGKIGTFDWDIASDTLILSHLYQELCGFKPGESNSTFESFLEQILIDDRPRIMAEVTRCIRARAPLATEFRVLRSDGSLRWLMMRGEFSSDSAGQALQLRGVVLDVSERKQHEEFLETAGQKAAESNPTKSDFLANMSHEIRTPLNAIIGMTYLALRADPAPQQQRYLKKIGNAAESLLGITNNILDFSKIEAGKLELERIPFFLEDVLNNLNDVVSQKAEQKGVALVFSVARGTPRQLIGDPLRLGQILINLLNNAVKFTEKGGVVVKVMVDDLSAKSGSFGFSISDTGIGMSAQQVSNIFRSFIQADASITRKYGGTGLGLAITKQLCELMGGTLTVESELGKGSTFLFRVPIQIAAGETPRAGAVRMSELKKSVLVIDDDEDARIELISLLYKNGFVARSASTGWEALSALASASQAGRGFDLVIMDWRLHGIDGVENSRRIQAHLAHASVPAILMISASDLTMLAGETSDPVSDAFLLKPVKEVQLIDAIATVFGVRPSGLLSEFRERQGPTHLAGSRVLLAEDNEMNRDLVTELLADLGIDVKVASDGREAVERVLAETFDLVLMDIQMPLMDGLTATRLIRADARFKDLPILAMTAHALSGDYEKCLLAGMSDHLTKPISPAKLLEAMTRWLPSSDKPAKVLEMKPKNIGVSKTASPAPPEPIDFAAALQRTDGNRELLCRLLSGFRGRYAEAGNELRHLVAEGKIDEAERLAHSLKGIAATLEARSLARAAHRLELAIRTRQTSEISSLIDAVENESYATNAAIDSSPFHRALSYYLT